LSRLRRPIDVRQWGDRVVADFSCAANPSEIHWTVPMSGANHSDVVTSPGCDTSFPNHWISLIFQALVKPAGVLTICQAMTWNETVICCGGALIEIAVV